MGDVDTPATAEKHRRLQNGTSAPNIVDRGSLDAGGPTVAGLGHDSAGRATSRAVVSAAVSVQRPRRAELLDVQVPSSVAAQNVVRFTTVEVTCTYHLNKILSADA